MFINLPTNHVEAMSQKQIFLGVLPTRWRRKPTEIDMEENYVTVILCIRPIVN